MAVYAAIHVPEFPAQALLRLRDGLHSKAVAVMEGERPLERVCSRNAQADRLGVECGMARAEVELFAVSLLRRSVKEEAAARLVLMNCLAGFTPEIEEHLEDTRCSYVLEMSGTERLSGPIEWSSEAIHARAAELGFAVRIAVADNFHTALCLARAVRQKIVCVPEGAGGRFLSSLPLASLDMSDEDAETLSSWGLRTLGELADLPEVDLIARLGQEGRRLRRLARGEHPHLFRPMEAAFALEEYVEFDAPVTMLDSLLFALNPMLEQMMKLAGSRALAITSVTVVCELEDAPPHCRTVRTALPTDDRRALLKLLQLDLEAHSPGAGVLAMRVTAEPGPGSKVQMGLFSPQLPEPMRLEVTLARVAAIVGEGRVGKPVLKDIHQRDAFAVERFAVERFVGEAAAKGGAQPSRQGFALRRLRPPAALRVDLVNGQPRTLWHERVRYEVNRLYGPWGTSGNWWSGQVWSEETWDFAAQAQDGSLLLGIVLHDRLRKAWLLEALYD